MTNLDELTAHCIRCGFCLESCPTFLLTGEETESPRGRIYLVRSANEGKLAWEDTRLHIDRCLGCRACETACPSGVEYGQIFEIARDELERRHGKKPKKYLLNSLTDPSKIRAQLGLSKLLPGRKIPSILSRLLSGEAPEADKPQAQPRATLPPLDESALPTVRGEVYLMEGCVMRVLFPRVHECTRRLLRRVGYAVREVDQGCCGSLHLHAGYMAEAQLRAQNLRRALSEPLPLIIDSAGCGSTIKEYDQLLEGRVGNSLRPFDASEFLFESGLADVLRASQGIAATATYHDACHLAHGQNIRKQPRDLLRAIPGLDLVELAEADTCCGSAGIYNLTQPHYAKQLLDRKWSNIEATGASFVVMGNPGCHAWLAQASREHGSRIPVLHTMEMLEASFIGMDAFATS